MFTIFKFGKFSNIYLNPYAVYILFYFKLRYIAFELNGIFGAKVIFYYEKSSFNEIIIKTRKSYNEFVSFLW